MESQIKSPSVVRPTVANSQCSFQSCDDLAVVDLDARPLCPAHFVPVCTQELELWNEQVRNQPFDATTIELFENFAVTCTQQVQELEKDERFADGQTNAQLREFVFRISQLRRRLRRTPRLRSAVAVWLRREDSSPIWEEETWTTTVSRHGASLVCHHPVQTGGTVVLCLKYGGIRVRARVVYCRYNSEGQREIGVELLDQDDIWGLGQKSRLDPAALDAADN
jgi:PilZ domain-containing protein